MNFWESIVSHKPGFSYEVEDSFQKFLACYHHQDKLATGYAFIAAKMFQMEDEGARLYLKKAYEEDPKDKNVLELLSYMGETETSIMKIKDDVERPQGAKDRPERPHHCRTKKSCEKHFERPDYRKLEEGWENERERDYVHTKSRLKSTPNMDITITPLAKFVVAWDKWWKLVNDGEEDFLAESFKILHKYLTTESIYVDVGAFYGPTIFFSSQVAKRSFGLEPDPVSFATIEHNLIFNPGNNIYVHGIAVAAPDDAGYVQFETDKMGNGNSMIVPELTKEKEGHFEAAGFTLPFLFALWGIDFQESPVLIKISVESYECKLLPSFYEWLIHENTKKLTILVTFNPHIKRCTKTEMEGVLDTCKLFSHVLCNDFDKPLPITAKTTFAEFEEILENQSCFTEGGKHHILLTGDF
eukprot:CAMPEP_0194213938 /NCGR_PEP_ID=MMETSP0156-20130528/14881_1 /TAXON_ID=33649 /ORGANISM="Thalassionema nitzschioides, Strain L26-B" /LENGTH=412 /DNA_ID=CAMNT_0038942087 /DNA_START=191 /DNA_END=1429 /DNA_ORIENTATION=+